MDKNVISGFKKHALDCLETFKRQYEEERSQDGLVGEQYILVDTSGLQAYQVSGAWSRPAPSLPTATRFSISAAERIVEQVEQTRGHELKIMKLETALFCAILIIEEMIANYDRDLQPLEA